MIVWLLRRSGAITFALTIILIILILANTWKHSLVSVEWLSKEKDALAALNSIATMIIVITGAVFSYYRFFKGRTLSLRMDLALGVTVHSTQEQYLIHAITLTAKNVGNSTIWYPTPKMTVRIHGPKRKEEIRKADDWWDINEDLHLAPVIDAGETVFFFTHQLIPDDAWAVSYSASLRADHGDVWRVFKTISNTDC
jgi:hypothetical protein